ncbi:DNA recombination protein RmuC [Rhodosalinus halophilus]|uniref:DNA recombination protein RmuC homolog n=1 Tax=Rhodosalinus halophilus TaxID=2259333 RepID=A0A365U9P1_9RHOB|nr:DNA recombination protein RmuC [Rhodosalinus halophilus]RBI85576.1 DNA recombination protein RmuC [Rhodosalinus halophilus]
MIEIGGRALSLEDPLVLAALGGAALVLLVIALLVAATRAAARAARVAEPLARDVGALGQRVQALSDGQQQLAGGLSHVSEAQSRAQAEMLRLMEARLAEVNARMAESLTGSARRTAQSLGELQERLKTIDRAQENTTRLSGDVLSLQDILSNKQTRGAFGEIQLHDILAKALPRDSYTLQPTLSTGARPDCIVHLPEPPGPIAIDSKFPLEAYEALRRAETPEAAKRAAQGLRQAVRLHVRAIADKYIVEGETADGAILFLPSEAVYAELHASFAETVREGFAARVWIVSPTTCMATLTTMRAILKDARMQAEAGRIRRELSLLHADVARLGTRVENLDRHFGQAARDISEIKVSAEKAGQRARRLDSFDFEELAPEPAARVDPGR